MKDGTGRSNALPIMQLVLGAALIVLGVLDGLKDHPDAWVGWVLAASGIIQIAVGVMTIRRNQRLDRLETGG